MPAPFDALQERLLRAGYAPRHVRRYGRELADHLADLTEGERAAGREGLEAQAAARARLGSDERLAEAMLMRPSLRSWTAKAPWAVLVAAPIAAVALAYVLPIAALMSSHPATLTESLQQQIRSASAFAAFTFPALISGSVTLAAARQRLTALWPMLGVVVIACVGAALRAHVLWPGHDPADPALWSVEVSFLPSPTATIWLRRFRETGLIDLAVGLAVYWSVRLTSARMTGVGRAPASP